MRSAARPARGTCGCQIIPSWTARSSIRPNEPGGFAFASILARNDGSSDASIEATSGRSKPEVDETMLLLPMPTPESHVDTILVLGGARSGKSAFVERLHTTV